VDRGGRDVIDELDALCDHERYQAARARVVESTSPDDAVERWRLALRRADLDLHGGHVPVDEAILGLQARLESVPQTVPPSDEARAWALLVDAFAIKRCFGLADAALVRGRERLGPRAEVELAAGRRALAVDDRAVAAARYAEAHALAPEDPSVAYALADLAYVEGRFDDCRRLVDAVGDGVPATWCAARRLLAAVHAAVQQWHEETAAWTAVLERLPESDRRARDLVCRGLSRAAADDARGAAEDFRTAWRLDPSSPVGRYAYERLGFLESEQRRLDHRRLPAFPSTQQKRNYCGPAVLELCLRYLEFDLSQDEIAPAVRRGEGTPMCAIVDYLATQGIEARRIAATPERLRAAIDLGLPVIVQEEYSITSHVAVITGYDWRVGVFIAADPATHRPTLKSFKWMEAAGDLFGNGGLIVLGRKGPQLDALRARADAAGLVQAEALELVDECDRRRAGTSGGVDDPLTPDEVVRLCDEAIDRDPAFKLAWERRTDALLRMWLGQRGNDPLHQAVLRSLYQVRTRWPHDEWPHQLYARYLDATGRTAEAFIAWFEAWRRDPDDAHDLSEMGFCKWQAGDLAGAEEHMLEALARAPHCRPAARGLAMVYLRQLEHDDVRGPARGADAVAADPFAHSGFAEPEVVDVPLERPLPELLERARHFTAVALDHAPDDPFALGVRGALLRRAGDVDGALVPLRRAVETAPDVAWTRLLAAACLEHRGAVDEALVLLEDGGKVQWRLPAMWLQRADLLTRRGDAATAAEVLTAAIEAGCDDRSRIAHRLFELFADGGTREGAAMRLRRLAERHRGDEALLRDVAWLLDNEGQRGHAIALFRFVVDAAPGDVGAIYQLGSLLARNLATRAEGLRLLERAQELAPDHPAPPLQIATTLLPTDPEAALQRLEAVKDSDNPLCWGVRAAALDALGQAGEAERALKRALDCAGDPIEGRVRLVRFHRNHSQYERAVMLARDLPLHPDDDDRREEAQDVWLSAHRLSGRQAEIAGQVEALCPDDVVPDHLAWEVYWAYQTTNRRLSAAAALRLAARESGADAAQWRVREASLRAKLGDVQLLDRGAELAGKHAIAWAQLVYAYDDNGRLPEAVAAAERAHELDPTDVEVLSALEHVQGRLLKFDEQMRIARRLLEEHPYEHQGPERVGWLLAKHGEVESALELTLQAVDAAPYCHVAHKVRAIALMMADRLDEARVHIRQAESITPTAEEDYDGDHWLVLCALEGDLSRFEHAWALHAAKEPEGSFPAFEHKVLGIARRGAAPEGLTRL
jgi:tetratricopeptide (TPR) repeat protein